MLWPQSTWGCCDSSIVTRPIYRKGKKERESILETPPQKRVNIRSFFSIRMHARGVTRDGQKNGIFYNLKSINIYIKASILHPSNSPHSLFTHWNTQTSNVCTNWCLHPQSTSLTFSLSTSYFSRVFCFFFVFEKKATRIERKFPYNSKKLKGLNRLNAKSKPDSRKKLIINTK